MNLHFHFQNYSYLKHKFQSWNNSNIIELLAATSTSVGRKKLNLKLFECWTTTFLRIKSWRRGNTSKKFDFKKLYLTTNKLFNSPVQFLFQNLKLMHFSYQLPNSLKILKNSILNNYKFQQIFQLKNKAKSILYSQKHFKILLSFYLKMFLKQNLRTHWIPDKNVLKNHCN